jgi:hypothetical protein
LKKVNFRRVFVVAALASLVLAYSLLWLRMITTPVEYTGADFIAFYAAGRIAQVEGLAYIYEPDRQQVIEQELVGFELVPGQVLLFNHLPYFVPILQLIIDENYVLSFIRWDLILLVVLILDATLLAYLLSRSGFEHGETWLAAFGIVLFFPIFTSLLNGQDTIFLLLGSVLWMLGLYLEKDILAGVGLSLVTIRPQLALILALPFLFRRRQVWWGFVAGTLALGAMCLFILGVDGSRNLIQLLEISARGEWYGLNPVEMPTLSGLLRRVVPGIDANVVHPVSWVAYFLTAAFLCFLWKRSKQIGEKEIGLAVVLNIFASPHLHYHDLALLLLSLTGLMVVAVREKYLSPRDAALLPFGISLLLLSSFVSPFLVYGLAYLFMLFLVLALWFPDRIFLRRQLGRKVEGPS